MFEAISFCGDGEAWPLKCRSTGNERHQKVPAGSFIGALILFVLFDLKQTKKLSQSAMEH